MQASAADLRTALNHLHSDLTAARLSQTRRAAPNRRSLPSGVTVVVVVFLGYFFPSSSSSPARQQRLRGGGGWRDVMLVKERKRLCVTWPAPLAATAARLCGCFLGESGGERLRLPSHDHRCAVWSCSCTACVHGGPDALTDPAVAVVGVGVGGVDADWLKRCGALFPSCCRALEAARCFRFFSNGVRTVQDVGPGVLQGFGPRS